MIQPLRTLHRRAMLIGIFLVPGLFSLGLAGRRSWPDGGFAQGQISAPFEPGKSIFPWPESAPQISLRAADGAGKILAFDHDEALLADIPDPLLYWTPRMVAPGDRLPEQAVFLAALRGPLAWSLPETVSASSEAGRLVIYSLALQEVRAVSRPFRWSELQPVHP